MTRINLLLIFQIILIQTVSSQQIHSSLDSHYKEYKEESLSQRRFKHAAIQPLIDQIRTWENFNVSNAGSSFEGRPISLITFGKGPKNVLLWSQMHGDESTATQALFDIFNFLKNDKHLENEIQRLSEALTIHFIPMLNPDGAERFQRRNAQHIDINRDAVRLQTPEGRLLKRIHDSLDVSFGFNLHDQSRYYNVKGSSKTAAISVLAPAFNEANDMNEIRERATRVIVHLNRICQVYAPGHVGRYSDDFEPRAFGDNIQSWGTSTILIESGGYPGDREKQFLRKLNYIAILESLFAIASNSYESEDLSEYRQIPENDSKMVDLKITNVNIQTPEGTYLTDIGINRKEVDTEDHRDYYLSAEIDDYGDLSTYYGYEELDADGLTLEFGKIEKEYSGDYSTQDVLDLLRKGVGYVQTTGMKQPVESLKINQVETEFEVPEFLEPGSHATFFLASEEGLRYAVINGFVVDLTSGDLDSILNAIIHDK